jgi:hypothetical protein
VSARQILLDGLARDVDIFELESELVPLHPRDNTFPGEVFLRLAADALDWCGASRADPLPLEGLRERFLPECTFRGRQNTKLQYAVLAAAALHGGTDPDLLDEVALVADRRLLAIRPVRDRRLHPRRRQPGRRAGTPGMPGPVPAFRRPGAIASSSGCCGSGHRTVGWPITTAVRVRAEAAVRHRRMVVMGIGGCGQLHLAVAATVRRSISRPVRLYRAAPAT